MLNNTSGSIAGFGNVLVIKASLQTSWDACYSHLVTVACSYRVLIVVFFVLVKVFLNPLLKTGINRKNCNIQHPTNLSW